MDSMNLSELSKLSDEIADLRLEVDAIEAQRTEKNKEIKLKEAKLIEALEASGLTSFKGAKGNFVVMTDASVKTPQTPEDKEAFFSWLKDKGLFETYATVNYQSLNSLYRQELESFEGEGDFKIPGVGEPSFNKSIRFKRA